MWVDRPMRPPIILVPGNRTESTARIFRSAAQHSGSVDVRMIRAREFGSGTATACKVKTWLEMAGSVMLLRHDAPRRVKWRAVSHRGEVTTKTRCDDGFLGNTTMRLRGGIHQRLVCSSSPEAANLTFATDTEREQKFTACFFPLR